MIADVPKKSPAVSEEKQGPARRRAGAGGAGLSQGRRPQVIDDAQIVKDEKKGDFYVARIDKPGRAAAEIVNEVLREAILNFPGRRRCASTPSSTTAPSCVGSGPLHSIVLLLDGKVVPFEIAGIKSARKRAAIASWATSRSR